MATDVAEKPNLQAPNAHGAKIFIGHGRSAEWRDLKDFIVEFHLTWNVLQRTALSGTVNWSAIISNRCRSSPAGPEENNLVVGVMPNVGASQPWNSGAAAPVTDDLLLVHSEIGHCRI